MKTIANITYPAFALFAFACFALSPQARAVDPPPDGGYPNGNTAEGDNALFSLTTGFGNTAIGYGALFSLTTGGGNTAHGWDALFSLTTGVDNTAIGYGALISNTIGAANTANGFEALDRNTTGNDNTANGSGALFNNTTGSSNTANGENALQFNTTGSNNIAMGYFAGTNLTTGDNNIHIGNKGLPDESNRIRIGTQRVQRATFIAGISGEAATGSPVIVSPNGRLGVTASSKRFKDQVKPMDKASEAILALKPVTFRYKQELDPDGIPQFGLVAEDVEKVNPDLVARDEQGKAYTVRYEAVNAMLLNEFLKEHRKVQALDATVAAQKKDFESQIAALTAALQAQASQIQKVSDQLRTQALAPRVVAND